MKNRSKLDIIFNIIIVLSAMVYLFVLYWMFTGSFKPHHILVRMPPQWFPLNPILKNYIELFSRTAVYRWIFNSLLIALGTTFLTVLFSSMAAYAFAKLKFFGNRVFFVLLLATLMIPKEIFIVPLFRMMNSLNLVGTYIGIILPTAATAFGVFLLKQFYEPIH